MHLSERLRLARATYRATVTAARRESSPRAWQRLVRAGQNLRDAEEEARRRLGAKLPRVTPSVLLVEDDAAARDALRDILSEHLAVWTASDGRSALELLRRMQHAPSVILLDLMLPNVSGWDLRRHLERDPGLCRVPVVVMSACRDATVRAARYFEKPFDVAELVASVSQLAR